jgi:hypothetical protein
MVKNRLFITFVAFVIGFLVTIGTAALLGVAQAKHLPGGSFAGGLAAGWQGSSMYRIPLWQGIILGAIAGTLGWLVATLFL